MPPDKEERVLHDLLGRRGVVKDAVGEAERRPTVPIVQGHERCRIAVRDRLNQVVVPGFGHESLLPRFDALSGRSGSTA